jgi:hypothetical protein
VSAEYRVTVVRGGEACWTGTVTQVLWPAQSAQELAADLAGLLKPGLTVAVAGDADDRGRAES